jgi:predicted RNase H-like HicB family nuclease
MSQNEASMKYKVVLKKSKEGYSVSCLGLPGCWPQGKTEAEALANIQHAIREYLDAAVKISKGAKVREVEVPV